MNKPELKEGEYYAGAIINPDGTGHHLILLPDDHDDTTWDKAMEWAKEQGGDLPNRVESALLFNQSKDQFKQEWYWTNEQYSAVSGCAGYQNFYDGGQSRVSKDNEFRARAVRRLPI
jgi:hypothetical protein